jgi:CheY-like chemotaxis protein
MKGTSILVADDNFNDLDFIGKAIMSYNAQCDVKYVYNGNQLLDFILRKGNYKHNTTWPELIILDITMPFLDGFAVLEELRNNSVTIPVYIFSDSDSRKHENRCYKLGVKGFYNKPSELKAYNEVICEILARSNVRQLPKRN